MERLLLFFEKRTQSYTFFVDFAFHILFPVKEESLEQDQEGIEEIKNFLAGVHEMEEKESLRYSYDKPKRREVVLAAFDPNSADSIEFLQRGLPPFIAHTILQYRRAGGKFRTADDFSRVYGLSSEKFNMLKPYIDRGDIKIIGATTKEEYRQFLFPDKALSRRFYPITIDEPDEKLTLSILYGSIPAIEYETKVYNAFSSDTTEKIRTLIAISSPENQPEDQSTKRPELPLTLLEMAFSYAALNEQETLSKQDIIQAIRHSNRLRKEIRTATNPLTDL